MGQQADWQDLSLAWVLHSCPRVQLGQISASWVTCRHHEPAASPPWMRWSRTLSLQLMQDQTPCWSWRWHCVGHDSLWQPASWSLMCGSGWSPRWTPPQHGALPRQYHRGHPLCPLPQCPCVPSLDSGCRPPSSHEAGHFLKRH